MKWGLFTSHRLVCMIAVVYGIAMIPLRPFGDWACTINSPPPENEIEEICVKVMTSSALALDFVKISEHHLTTCVRLSCRSETCCHGTTLGRPLSSPWAVLLASPFHVSCTILPAAPPPPREEQQQVLFPSNFGILVLLLQGGGGVALGAFGVVRWICTTPFLHEFWPSSSHGDAHLGKAVPVLKEGLWR